MRHLIQLFATLGDMELEAATPVYVPETVLQADILATGQLRGLLRRTALPVTLEDMELEAAPPVNVLETVLWADTRQWMTSLGLLHRTVRPATLAA